MTSIDDLWTRWQDAFNRADMKALAAIYSADAKYYTPDGRVDEGRDAIVRARQAERDAVAAWMQGATFRSTIESSEMRTCGDVSVDRGWYRVATDDGRVLAEGHYFAVVREVDGAWTIEHHMATSTAAGRGSS
jgi:uncharacterized protein (TIGR02246 family)